MPYKSHKRGRSEEKGVLELLKRMDKRIKLLEVKNTRKHRNQISSGSESDSRRSVSNSSYDSEEGEKNSESERENAQGSDRENSMEGEPILPIEGDTASSSIRPLDNDMLAILREGISHKIVMGDPIQPEIAERWQYIAKNGLDESIRQQLIGKYPPPENGTLLVPPQLNLMVKQAIYESVLRRDERLSKIQLQLAASLSAVGHTLSHLLVKQGRGEEGIKRHIEALSDAGRLIGDVMHSESMSRRELVAFDLTKEWKNTLVESPLDKWLFGEDLEGRLKTAKDLQVSSRQLKSVKTISRQNTSNMSRSRSLPHLNSRSLPLSQQGAKRCRRSAREAPQNRQR